MLRNPYRVRERTKSTTLVGHHWTYVNHMVLTHGTCSSEKVTLQEHIRDTVGFPKCRHNPVYHDKLYLLDKPIPYVNRETLSGQTSLQFSAAGLLTKGLREALREVHPLPDTVWVNYLTDFSTRANRHFIEAIQDGPSIVNFILEILDLLKGSWDTYNRLLGKLAAALELFFRTLRKYPGNFWLAWNFAVKPMMADIQAFLDQTKRLRKRLKWLEKVNRRVVSVRYRESPYPISGTTYCDIAWPVSTPALTQWVDLTYRITYTGKVRMAALGDVRFSIPEWIFTSSNNLFLAALDLNWIFNPLKILWEATPFSWLADWFVGSPAKDQFNNVELSPFEDAELVRASHSVKMELEGSIELVDSVTGIVYDGGNFVYTLYTRKPDLPPLEAGPFRVPDSWYNLSILSSIIAQRKR